MSVSADRVLDHFMSTLERAVARKVDEENRDRLGEARPPRMVQKDLCAAAKKFAAVAACLFSTSLEEGLSTSDYRPEINAFRLLIARAVAARIAAQWATCG